MLAANEAKRQTQNNIDDGNTSELIYLDKYINNAVKNGAFHLGIPGKLHYSTQKKLKELGYKIKIDNNKNGQSYSIIDWT